MLVASWRYQPGEGSSRGLLHDCKIFANMSFEALSGGHRGGGEDAAEDPEHLDPETGHNCFI